MEEFLKSLGINMGEPKLTGDAAVEDRLNQVIEGFHRELSKTNAGSAWRHYLEEELGRKNLLPFWRYHRAIELLEPGISVAPMNTRIGFEVAIPLYQAFIETADEIAPHHGIQLGAPVLRGITTGYINEILQSLEERGIHTIYPSKSG